MISPLATERLLSLLCADLGFCLAPEQQQHLVQATPSTPLEFTKTVLISEGMDPDTVDRHVFKQILDRVTRTYEQDN